MSLLARLEDAARPRRNRTALAASGRWMSFGELLDASSRRAEELAARPGPAELPGEDPIRFLVEFFAAQRAGVGAVARPAAEPVALKELRDRVVQRIPPPPGVTVFFSSGSVGSARAVPLSPQNLAAAALAFESWGDLSASDRVAVGLSPAQIFGFVRGALNALLVGAETVFFAPRRDPLEQAAGLSATVVLLPSALVALAARHRTRPEVRSLRCGGGVLPPGAADAVEEVRGVPVRSGYGMTESAGLGTRQPSRRRRRPGSSGLPAPGMAISIVGDDGLDRRTGEAGEIRLSGAAVFSGYLLPEVPPPFDERGRLRTGDAGFLDTEGELCVQGRLAFSLCSGDRVVCAEEVEAAIAEHPGVAEAAAAPLARAFGVLVVPREDSETLMEEIRAYAERRLPAFARPRRILRVSEIPKTPAGKIDREEASRWLSGSTSGV